jgi:hypothetical protein
MQDTFYEHVYWKYHCKNQKPDTTFCHDHLSLDSSQVVFLSTTNDEKDCFIINIETGNCGCYAGSSGSGFVLFKRQKDGSYYHQNIWAFDLERLKTSHQGIYDVSCHHRRHDVTYHVTWTGKNWQEMAVWENANS